MTTQAQRKARWDEKREATRLALERAGRDGMTVGELAQAVGVKSGMGRFLEGVAIFALENRLPYRLRRTTEGTFVRWRIVKADIKP